MAASTYHDGLLPSVLNRTGASGSIIDQTYNTSTGETEVIVDDSWTVYGNFVSTGYTTSSHSVNGDTTETVLIVDETTRATNSGSYDAPPITITRTTTIGGPPGTTTFTEEVEVSSSYSNTNASTFTQTRITRVVRGALVGNTTYETQGEDASTVTVSGSNSPTTLYGIDETTTTVRLRENEIRTVPVITHVSIPVTVSYPSPSTTIVGEVSTTTIHSVEVESHSFVSSTVHHHIHDRSSQQVDSTRFTLVSSGVNSNRDSTANKRYRFLMEDVERVEGTAYRVFESVSGTEPWYDLDPSAPSERFDDWQSSSTVSPHISTATAGSTVRQSYDATTYTYLDGTNTVTTFSFDTASSTFVYPAGPAYDDLSITTSSRCGGVVNHLTRVSGSVEAITDTFTYITAIGTKTEVAVLVSYDTFPMPFQVLGSSSTYRRLYARGYFTIAAVVSENELGGMNDTLTESENSSTSSTYGEEDYGLTEAGSTSYANSYRITHLDENRAWTLPVNVGPYAGIGGGATLFMLSSRSGWLPLAFDGSTAPETAYLCASAALATVDGTVSLSPLAAIPHFERFWGLTLLGSPSCSYTTSTSMAGSYTYNTTTGTSISNTVTISGYDGTSSSALPVNTTTTASKSSFSVPLTVNGRWVTGTNQAEGIWMYTAKDVAGNPNKGTITVSLSNPGDVLSYDSIDVGSTYGGGFGIGTAPLTLILGVGAHSVYLQGTNSADSSSFTLSVDSMHSMTVENGSFVRVDSDSLYYAGVEGPVHFLTRALKDWTSNPVSKG